LVKFKSLNSEAWSPTPHSFLQVFTEAYCSWEPLQKQKIWR